MCTVYYITIDDVFVSVCPDEDDEGERNSVPLTPLDSFFSDDSLKQQKKKKPKKMKEGKMPKVKKRKKEVRCNSHSTPSAVTSDTTAWQVIWLKLYPTFFIFSNHHPFDVCSWIKGVFWLLDCLCNLNERQWTVSGSGEVGSIAGVSYGH